MTFAVSIQSGMVQVRGRNWTAVDFSKA